jgi:hypothetical protein
LATPMALAAVVLPDCKPLGVGKSVLFHGSIFSYSK